MKSLKSFVPLPVTVVAVLGLAACASSPRTGIPLPAAAGGAAQAVSDVAGTGTTAGRTIYGAADTGGTDPDSTVRTTEAETGGGSSGAPEAAGDAPILLKGPDGAVWVKPGTGVGRYRADIEACDTYARAQIDHDVRIESDMGAAFDSSDAGFGLTALRHRMRSFERTRRRPALFSDCMNAKGYTRG
ncbi:MAG: hypothetical protein ACE5KF_06890 [Kiloniellaceae bacterium]